LLLISYVKIIIQIYVGTLTMGYVTS